jgi:hypothetical protein
MPKITDSESALRRRASREGYVLRKSRARNWRPDDQGGYMLVDASHNAVVLGSHFDADLEDVAKFLR